MTWVSITQNLDAVRQNFYLYAEPMRSGHEWRILMWDADISFSNHWAVDKASFDVAWRHMLDGGNHFSRRLVSMDSLRHEFVDRFEERLVTDLSTDAPKPSIATSPSGGAPPPQRRNGAKSRHSWRSARRSSRGCSGSFAWTRSWRMSPIDGGVANRSV
jgi:hypothetical protein